MRINIYARLFITALLILASDFTSYAQHNHQERLYYFGQHSLNERSKLSFGAGWHTMPADAWNRIELRTTHFYTINQWLMLAYGQRSNFAFEDGYLLSYELRPFQAVNFFHDVSRYSKITHRIMFEERFLFNKNQENIFYGRIRYRMELKKPVINIESLYVRPMTEIFYSLEGTNKNSITQWKNTMALGYSIQNNIKVEARYEYMLLNKNNFAPDFENLNGYRIQFIHTF